jgi:signal transduction histidine kinase
MAALAQALSREARRPMQELMGRLGELRTRLESFRNEATEPGPGEREHVLDELGGLLEECLRSAERVDGVAASVGRLGGGDGAARTGFQLNAAVADAVTLLERRIEGSAELELRLGKLPDIAGEEGELSHAVAALLTNALEAVERSGARGRIIVTTYRDEKGATLRISDNGPGIDPDLLSRACDPFVTTKKREPGAGLGLHAARAALEAQGGELRLTSKPGEGTSVTAVFALPVSDPAVQTASSHDAAD